MRRGLSSRVAAAAAAVAFASVLAGCGLADQVAEETGARRVPVAGAVTLTAETFNGSVEVVGGESGVVGLGWTKRGSSPDSLEAAKADLANVEVVVTTEAASVRVTARRKDGHDARRSGVSLRVSVPRGTPVTLGSDNGAIEVRGVGAVVRAKTSNGHIDVTDGADALSLETRNGHVTASGTGVRLTVKTANGRVDFSGSLAAGDSRVESQNGAIEVSLPGDAALTLDARTRNGSVSCDFPFSSPTTSGRMRLGGTIGANPAAQLALVTSNGSVRVRRS